MVDICSGPLRKVSLRVPSGSPSIHFSKFPRTYISSVPSSSRRSPFTSSISLLLPHLLPSISIVLLLSIHRREKKWGPLKCPRTYPSSILVSSRRPPSTSISPFDRSKDLSLNLHGACGRRISCGHSRLSLEQV